MISNSVDRCGLPFLLLTIAHQTHRGLLFIPFVCEPSISIPGVEPLPIGRIIMYSSCRHLLFREIPSLSISGRVWVRIGRMLMYAMAATTIYTGRRTRQIIQSLPDWHTHAHYPANSDYKPRILYTRSKTLSVVYLQQQIIFFEFSGGGKIWTQQD